MKAVDRHKVIRGKPIAGGIVLGTSRVVLPGETQVTEVAVPDAALAAEIKSLELAVKETVSELDDLRDSAIKKMGGPAAKIFEAQLMIAQDEEFLGQVKKDIKSKKLNAAFIYNEHIKRATAPLKKSADSYIRQMALDIEAVASRIISHLSGKTRKNHIIPPNTVLIGKSFTPGEVLSYRRQKVIGFVVAEGGPDSHMGLIARALYLPVVISKDLNLSKLQSGQPIILDAIEGKVIMAPTAEEISDYQQRRKKMGPALITRIKHLKEIPPKTRDGVEIPVGGNMTLPGPAEEIMAEKNIPIGLYRSEFLYLAKGTFPDEDTQFEHYEQVAKKFAGSSVVIRTFDLGYDKMSADDAWPHEENPALGWRGIRPMLEMKSLFKDQIRAILRASSRKNLKILLPMISDISEYNQAKRLISQVKFELKKKKVLYDENIPIGIMVEVPSTVLIADSLFPKVDFLSIGTNDLTQYVLAADRKNSKVAGLYSCFHPAVLQMIKMTVDKAKIYGKPVAVCGEMAGDILALPFFIGLKIDLLSMSPNRIVDLCRIVKKIDSSLVQPLVHSVLASSSTSSVIKRLESFKNAIGSRRQKGSHFE